MRRGARPERVRLAGVVLLAALAAGCSAESGAPFEYEQVGTATATVGGVFLEVDYGPDEEARRRGAVTRLGRVDGDRVVQAGVFVQSGGDGEGGTTYVPGAGDEVDAPGVELIDRSDSFLIADLDPGDYLICAGTRSGDLCATFTVDG